MSATVISKEVEAHKPCLLDILIISKVIQKEVMGTSLVLRWLRIHLATQGMRVQSMVGELRSHTPRGNLACPATREDCLPQLGPDAAKVSK